MKEEGEKSVEKAKASGSESKPQSQSQSQSSQPQSQGGLETDPQYFLVKHETGVLIRDKCTKLVFEGLLLVANDDESRTAAAKIASDIEGGKVDWDDSFGLRISLPNNIVCSQLCSKRTRRIPREITK